MENLMERKSEMENWAYTGVERVRLVERLQRNPFGVHLMRHRALLSSDQIADKSMPRDLYGGSTHHS